MINLFKYSFYFLKSNVSENCIYASIKYVSSLCQYGAIFRTEKSSRYKLCIVSGTLQCREMNNLETRNIWQPCEDMLSICKGSNYAVLILNSPINFSFNPTFVINLWNQANVRVTVDGGTEKWLMWLRINELEFEDVLVPDLITGDMDSLPVDVLNYFTTNHTTKIIKTPNEDETDFTKALRELAKHVSSQKIKIETVYVLADTCGRFDQIMGNVNTLYKSQTILPGVKVYQVASNSLTWLLPGGSHIISIPETLRETQEWCALIPIGGPCRVTTSGLKWNLEKSIVEFGGMVSTSNTYDGSENVTVQTDHPLIWSMGIHSLF